MKSKTSCFNSGIAKNMLRRSWPMWLVFLALMLIILPIDLANEARYEVAGKVPDDSLLSMTASLPGVMCVLSVLVVMVQYAFLYNTRGCGLMNSLPIRRETTFWTAWLMGLMPMLLIELLVACFTMLLTLLYPVSAAILLYWLGAAVGCTLCFYGIAVFCAMLTGSILVLPAVYAVFNLLAFVVYGALQTIMAQLLYGYTDTGYPYPNWLSPVFELETLLNVNRQTNSRVLGTVVLYALAGLVLSYLALRLYRKRRMESATDTVAIPVLKPVFKYCMGFGTALVAPSVLMDLLFPGVSGGPIAFWLILGEMLLGAVVGWFAARMILLKSVRVFRGDWKGLALVCAIIILFCSLTELDVTGYETRFPRAEEISSVKTYAAVLEEPENIAEVLRLHKSVVEHKKVYDGKMGRYDGENASYGRGFTIHYTLNDGRELVRSYRIFGTAEDLKNPESDLSRYAAILNTEESIQSQAIFKLPVSADTLSYANLCINWQGGSNQFSLSTAQALDFYENALLPDVLDGKIGRFSYGTGEIVFSNAEVSIQLAAPAAEYPELIGVVETYNRVTGPTWTEPQQAVVEGKWYQIPMDAERCVQWIRENTPCDPEPSESVTMSRSPYGVG